MTISLPNVNELIDPIPGDDLCGSDVSFDAVFDEIREARRQDDASLAQGEWETDLKTAQWPRVKELCEEVLIRRSKDMQIAAWYAEAMTRLKGFSGLALGLQVMDSLLSDFWEFCYPLYDPEDLDERAGKIEWLNKQLPVAIREIPLTARTSGAYSWLKWEESRYTDNLGLKDAQAREKALAEGMLSGEQFDKAVQTSGLAYYQNLQDGIQDARAAAAVLVQHVDERFGSDAPSLKEIIQVLQTCDELVGKFLARLGGDAAIPPLAEQAAQPETPPADTARNESMPQGPITTRHDAIRALREAAVYFRRNEPHSPVALLAERAANWAGMPLERWLASVIKDQSTLGQLRELLDIREQPES